MTPFPQRTLGLLALIVLVAAVLWIGRPDAPDAPRLARIESEVAAAAHADTARWIQAHQVVVGMGAAQVVAAWGQPREKNRTTTANHVREQWVYGDAQRFVYLDDGLVTAIQD
jgi:hypothetical protein